MNGFVHGLLVIAIALFISACATPNTGDSIADADKSATNSGAPSGKAAGTVGNVAAGSAAEGGKAPNRAKSEPDPTFAPASAPSKAEQLLADGLELYEKGDFKAAIRKLTGARDAFADNSVDMQTSLKYLAFSACVTGQKAFCKIQFAALLKIAPEFQLTRAEAGHPLWGPVFKETKAVTKTASTTATSSAR